VLFFLPGSCTLSPACEAREAAVSRERTALIPVDDEEGPVMIPDSLFVSTGESQGSTSINLVIRSLEAPPRAPQSQDSLATGCLRKGVVKMRLRKRTLKELNIIVSISRLAPTR
jgi:hypothetical protein